MCPNTWLGQIFTFTVFPHFFLSEDKKTQQTQWKPQRAPSTSPVNALLKVKKEPHVGVRQPRGEDPGSGPGGTGSKLPGQLRAIPGRLEIR